MINPQGFKTRKFDGHKSPKIHKQSASIGIKFNAGLQKLFSQLKKLAVKLAEINIFAPETVRQDGKLYFTPIVFFCLVKRKRNLLLETKYQNVVIGASNFHYIVLKT